MRWECQALSNRICSVDYTGSVATNSPLQFAFLRVTFASLRLCGEDVVLGPGEKVGLDRIW